MQMQMQHPNSQQQGLLEDLFTPITHSWTTFPDEDPFFLHSFGDNTFIEEDDSYLGSSSSTFLQLISSSSIHPTFPNLSSFTPVNLSNSSSYEQQVYEYDDKPRSLESFPEGYPTMVEQEEDKTHEEHDHVVASDHQIPYDLSSGEKNGKAKKVEGQPSKNLMAERRRRKRLNDRLSMLRSIVPRITKMDRTSILGDAIDYMKELLEKIGTLKEEVTESDSNSLNLMGSLKESIVNDAQTRNQPKFEVERRNTDTHVQIRCATKPGLLISTVNALEALGLDIQQCVISSFGDFTLQASCSEAPGHLMTSVEEIKQILIRNASCGGRSL
ncbi:hypothetical protein L1987_68399 [Smallanthus sonchifolius]|uniref:Uncharacterized protein n=1 Tax=Smallanthus sonchifolius TaxID=185202 RepID=A0ACB9B4E3_9ASTR|nr:hypothetical protein L1987_68399 [Smallanthus sonchifolius]